MFWGSLFFQQRNNVEMVHISNIVLEMHKEPIDLRFSLPIELCVYQEQCLFRLRDIQALTFTFTRQDSLIPHPNFTPNNFRLDEVKCILVEISLFNPTTINRINSRKD